MIDPVRNGGPTVAEQLAEATTTLRFGDIPENVVATAKLLILDQLGVQVRGSTLLHVQPERRLVEDLEAHPHATIANSRIGSSAAQAAFANGTFGHSQEYDDCHLRAWHAGSVVIPAALAVAEWQSRSGRDLLTAVVAGHQVMSVIGSVCTPAMQRIGWHGPKTIGGFGAAAASARLLGLTPGRTAHAFAIAASDASGTMEYDRSGGEVKRLHAGAAARSGVEAAVMARHGLSGPLTIFEGPRGVFRIFGETEASDAVGEHWSTWHLSDTMFRLRPGVGTVQPAVDILDELLRDHKLHCEDVREIEVGLPEFAVDHGAGIVHPHDGISAHFSLAFAIALRIVTGASRPGDYLDSTLWRDPAIRGLSALVRAVPHPFPASMPLLSARLRIELTDGTVLSGEQGGFRGSTDIPASAAEIELKFRSNLDHQSLDADRIIELVDELDELDDAGDLARSLAPSP